MPKELISEFRNWISVEMDDFEDWIRGDDKVAGYSKTRETGLELAKKLKKFVGDKHKVMYQYSEVKLTPNGEIQYTPLDTLEVISRKIIDSSESILNSDATLFSDETGEFKAELGKTFEELKKNVDKLKNNIRKEPND